MQEQEMIEIVRECAEENYYLWSWDVVATEWSDADIAAAIAGAKTRRGAISKAYGAMVRQIDSKRSNRSRPRKPISLVPFLVSIGGIRSDEKMISDLRQVTGGGNLFVPPYGWLIREHKQLSTAALLGGAVAPKFLDEARSAAVQAGYLQDTPWDGGESTSTINDLLDAIDAEVRDGRKVWPHGEAPFEPTRRDEREESSDEIPF